MQGARYIRVRSKMARVRYLFFRYDNPLTVPLAEKHHLRFDIFSHACVVRISPLNAFCNYVGFKILVKITFDKNMFQKLF